MTIYQWTRRHMQEDLNPNIVIPCYSKIWRPSCFHTNKTAVWRKFYVLPEMYPAFTCKDIRRDVYETGVISKRIRCRMLEGGGMLEVAADANAERRMEKRKEIKGKWDKNTRKQGANKEGKRNWGKNKIEEHRIKVKKVGRKRTGNKRISRTVSVYTTLHSFVCCNRDLLVSRLPPFSSISPPAQRLLPFPRGWCYFFMSYCNVSTAASPHRKLSPRWGVWSYSASPAKPVLPICGCRLEQVGILTENLVQVAHVYACSYELTPWSTVLLEELKKKKYIYIWNLKFINVFTRSRHWFLYCARSVHPTHC